MNSRSAASAMGNEKRFRSVSYTLLFFIMACVVLTLGIFIHHLLPRWHADIIAGILLFLVMDRLYTYRQLKTLTRWSSEWLIATGVQAVVIVFVIRFLLSYVSGPDALITDLARITRGNIVDLITPEFIITLVLAFATWELITRFLELLDEIGLDMRLALIEERPVLPGDPVPAHQRMTSLIFTTGILLVILTALTRINFVGIENTGGIPVELNRFSGAEAGALLYFVFGFALLSLSRLMSLQTHWNRLRIPVSSDHLPRQWALYSLLLLVTLAIFVSLLPAGDSFGFFSVIGMLLNYLFNVLFFLSEIFVVLVLLLFSLPFLLLGKAPPFASRFASPTLPTLPTEPLTPITDNALWELIRSILLWGSLIVILIFSFLHFLRQHEGIVAALRKSRVVNWLVLAWQWLYRNVDKTRAGISSAIADGWQQMLSRLGKQRIITRPGWISLRSLDPRRKVYFFYLAMIRRAGERGVMRTPSQTPSEYAARLERAVPSATADIDSITDAFVQARYSRQEIDSEKASRVKATWERIRQALREKAKRDKTPPS